MLQVLVLAPSDDRALRARLHSCSLTMGSSASKAARKLPKRTDTPSWAGARTPSASHDAPGRLPERELPQRPLASEYKTEGIQKDSGDPDFLANLSRLGPVRVDHHMQSVHPVPDATRMLNSRKQFEQELDASQGIPPRNRLPAYALSELLDARKSAISQAAINDLAVKYNIDPEKLELLGRTVNSPSVDPSTTVKSVDKEENESVSMTAVWVEPQIRAA
ncbi:hypothetical protein HGRIS_013249 [Hohenbuehelia grisea]|uniref:Uncharacterized protein n=1 Tax=Hohenbuehelia grisea TaxID=104357 RepID=A0ABR3IV27_9AGAR